MQGRAIHGSSLLILTVEMVSEGVQIFRYCSCGQLAVPPMFDAGEPAPPTI